MNSSGLFQGCATAPAVVVAQGKKCNRGGKGALKNRVSGVGMLWGEGRDTKVGRGCTDGTASASAPKRRRLQQHLSRRGHFGNTSASWSLLQQHTPSYFLVDILYSIHCIGEKEMLEANSLSVGGAEGLNDLAKVAMFLCDVLSIIQLKKRR